MADVTWTQLKDLSSAHQEGKRIGRYAHPIFRGAGWYNDNRIVYVCVSRKDDVKPKKQFPVARTNLGTVVAIRLLSRPYRVLITPHPNSSSYTT